ncbi:Phage minor structural protein GP20 [Ruminococcus sp. YE71]|uniref:phage scaffolding protein n=1 Tax=unclassified Ruminococcus TaxID=2608920 RepID=UPI0008811E96|nr:MULTISPECIES: phage scaffolding protein [unclassified Ruminococcus]SDA20108.1 Phage minor structural protein GP20 [Ruminococcus sp. YE78]SFW31832.1 Phage minor structural protein GP20 [Ruminococcus sp. YE71]
MELKQLTDLGIPEEQAKQALGLHTAEMEAEQGKVADLTAQLETAQKSIGDLTEQVKKFDGEDIEGLKQAAKDWETKYNADVAALKVDKALELALVGAKARDVEIVKSQLDCETLKLGDDGKLTGLTEQLDKLRADKAFLFDEDTADSGARIDTGFRHGTAAEDITDAQVRAVMGLTAEGGNK